MRRVLSVCRLVAPLSLAGAVALAEVDPRDAGSAVPAAGPAAADPDSVVAPAGFRYIPPGTFVMGSPADELGRGTDEIQHEVTLTRGFLLAEHPVTEAQWATVHGGTTVSDLPQAGVSWFEAVAFCNELSRRQGLQPAYHGSAAHWHWIQDADGYRLPTEAEWEYACRAGSAAALALGPLTHTGCDDPLLDRLGWYCGNSRGERQPVGRKTPNAWGLYDMHGNVWEWCWDRWGHQMPLPVTDPTGPEFGTHRTVRGGSFSDGAQSCRCAQRISFLLPATTAPNIGFRLARTVLPEGPPPPDSDN